MQSVWLPRSLGLSVESSRHLADRGGWGRVEKGGGGRSPQGPERAVQWGIQARLLADWVCKDTSGALPPHLTVPASSKRVGTLGPPGTRRHHQLLRAGVPGCPRNGPWPPPRAHFLRSLVLALSPARSLARSGTSPRPPFARRPRLLLTRPSPAPGAARPEPRRAARPPRAPDPTARISLPRSFCLDPSA